MPRVRPHTRRDGTRVRGHSRRRPNGGLRLSIRRRSTRRNARENLGLLAAVVAGLVLLMLVVEFVRRHPWWSAFLLVAAVGGTVAVLTLLSRQQARQRAEQAERDRLISVTDAMSGSEFEHWFARLLTVSGFTGVRVCGGAGDRGADVIGTAPDGRRVVVQCKRYGPGNRVGSAAIQKFAGTCRHVHRGEICMIVTNGEFAAGDGLHLARQLDILLVDRTALKFWAHNGTAPPLLARRWQPPGHLTGRTA